MRTRVCSGQNVETVLRCVDAEREAGLNPTLAIVFCSVVQDFRALGRGLDDRGIAVAGVTTSGEIANDELFEESTVTMLLEMDPAAFAIEFRDQSEGSTMVDLARSVGAAAAGRFANPVVFAFASGLQTNGEDIVQGIPAGAGRIVPLFGGMAGDDLTMKNSFVFTGHAASEAGLLGLVLDGDRFEVRGIATNGWQAVGVEKIVTRSEGNVVYTIDDEPAMGVYKKYMSIPEDALSADGNIAMALGVQYPLSVRRSDGTTVIRAPLLFNPADDSMIFAGGVPQGARVKFCIPPSLDIVERVVDEATQVQQTIPDADALILIACVARRIALGPLAEDEVEGLYGLWDAPMLGYFSYGEIGAQEPQECDFHTETCTMVALREVRA